MNKPKVLLVGISTRALAQSAAAAGYPVISLDFFGDSDQPVQSEIYSLVRDFNQPPSLKNLAIAARSLVDNADRVVIEAGLENEPEMFSICSTEKRWFNSQETVTGVRHLHRLGTSLSETGMELPEIIYPGEVLPTGGRYLVKDGAHSGGMGVKVWDGFSKLAEGEILEKYVDGILASACFLANGKHALLLGISRQYSGVKELGAPPFAWCGNTTPFGDDNLKQIVNRTIDCLTASFGLVGLNGIDFIINNNTCTLLEVNPRPPASFELFERLLGVNAFQLHLDACHGILPAALPEPPPGTSWGKGILYASIDIRVGDTRSWSNRQIVDVPHPEEDIPTDAPICTILSQAETGDLCWQAILEKAISLKSEMESLQT